MASRAQRSAATLAELSGRASSARFVDMQVSIRVADVANDNGKRRWLEHTDDELGLFGGRFDRRTKAWAGDAAVTTVLRLHRGQEAAARCLVDWLRRSATDDWADFKRFWTVELVGGRRSGKSHLAMIALLAFAITTPRAVLLCVSPTREHGDELDRALRALARREWCRRFAGNTGRSVTYRFVNGATITLRSGYKADAGGLRIGRVDFALLNEAQMIPQRAHTDLRASVADRGGLVLLACNPPDDERGRWVEDLWLKIQEDTVDAVGFELSPLGNPLIEYAALESLKREVSDRQYQRDVLGLFTSIGDIVMHAFTAESVREPWEGLVDITAQVIRRQLKQRAAWLIGVDLQKTPACVAVAVKILRDPAQPGEELAFVVDEFEGKDEDELIDVIEGTPVWRFGDRDYETYRGARLPTESYETPTHAAAVLDASAWWQDAAHNKGQESDRIFAKRGWRHLFKPNPSSDRNPEIAVRMRLSNARLCNAAGVRRLFISPRCKATLNAFRTYPNLHGKPDRRHITAHWIDAATYPLFALYGSVKTASATGGYHAVGRYKRAELFSDRDGDDD